MPWVPEDRMGLADPVMARVPVGFSAVTQRGCHARSHLIEHLCLAGKTPGFTQTEDTAMMSMRRLSLVAIAGLALSTTGCATSEEWVDWRGHTTHFASGDHGFFSLRNDKEGRYPRVTRLDLEASRTENWWGKTISVDSAQIIQN